MAHNCDNLTKHWWESPALYTTSSLLIAVFALAVSFRANQVAQQSLNVTLAPSLGLGCLLRFADFRRVPASEKTVYIAPAGIDETSIQIDFSDLATVHDQIPPGFDMAADQDIWSCTLHNFARLPLLNVALRFPVIVKDKPTFSDAPNYVVCVDPIPSVQPDGEVKFVLVNASEHDLLILPPLDAGVTVPSVGRQSASIVMMDVNDPFRALTFSVLQPKHGFVRRKDEPISVERRLHCAKAQEQNIRDLEDEQKNLTALYGR